MGLSCPYCGHGMKIKNPKPGRYKPKCSKCSERFSLTVPAEAGADFDVRPLPRVSDNDQMTRAESGAGTRHEPAASDAPPTNKRHPGDTVGTDPALAPADKTVDVGVTAPTPASEETPGAITKADDIEATFVLPAAALPETHSEAVRRDKAAPLEKTAPENIAHDATAPARVDATTAAVGDVAGSESSHDGRRFEQLGGYRILKELGRGAMGTVYLANQTSLDRQVALKTIQAQWCQNPATVARFTREAYAAAQLTHHNVVQIYDLGSDQGVNFYSMEFVKGMSLADLIAQQGKLGPETAVGYILQAARGLNFAHGHGMVHRDVKPANLMLSDLGDC